MAANFSAHSFWELARWVIRGESCLHRLYPRLQRHGQTHVVDGTPARVELKFCGSNLRDVQTIHLLRGVKKECRPAIIACSHDLLQHHAEDGLVRRMGVHSVEHGDVEIWSKQRLGALRNETLRLSSLPPISFTQGVDVHQARPVRLFNHRGISFKVDVQSDGTVLQSS
ncbi:hypothetical protein D9757_010260 [Collybiopsis confluens]|uniref:Uncharacterized protein n=1 Tax=Collybiopsis confluens TaxID=2823264 RepID=A0A8H5HB14_9AGAR|nr:hypothetical protein D9757_010260 [Collybiopsis confluens]